ncbi:hypothetical protein Sme01_19960 [Sphaerisporangium melleum]|uniref:Mersacidin/lichenicidin family type 2 lantibiotic n=1 Tax=Sphaerisporangium melleum TaxID=321316 RepID=A0A917RLY0_9ACTN|nr:hypothetical protein [Sphaerisporangium melleum]GGL13268.1 hypothetical protein GCM10007964_64230 [Sphaerisporangium melleum]GII69520.1 hypothetical protein Sme01_19960 [Sphaerisporangium melleum]
MSDNELIRQWKNPQARAEGLVHPAGDITLDEQVVGGMPPATEGLFTWGCCKPTWGFCI